MTKQWLDQTLYPFTSHFIDLEAGRMHYLDEGQGTPILFVHGTPTWSFLYRDLIKRLSARYRCIAPDHIGFGLSDKPAEWTYRPSDHAQNLATLIDSLELQNIVLVVHDYGGPIGLSYAIDHPTNVAGLVVSNTWMWPLTDNRQIQQVDSVLRGPIGKWLYMRLNISPRVLLPSLWMNKSTLTPAVRRAYTSVHQRPEERRGMYQLARELLGSTDWYQQLWQRREQLSELPALLLWGRKDATFSSALERWQAVLPNAQTVSFSNVGHFVVEEAPQVATQIESFLERLVSDQR